jgi:hypothetical protein
MLGGSPDGLHLISHSTRVRDLHQFTVALARSLRPKRILSSQDLPRIIVEEDGRQLRRLLAMRLRDIWRRFPNNILPPLYSPLEDEVVQFPWVAVFLAWFRPFSNGDLDGHREFLEG